MIDFDNIDDDEADYLVASGFVQTCHHCCEPGFNSDGDRFCGELGDFRAWNNWYAEDGLPFCPVCHEKLFNDNVKAQGRR